MARGGAAQEGRRALCAGRPRAGRHPAQCVRRGGRAAMLQKRPPTGDKSAMHGTRRKPHGRPSSPHPQLCPEAHAHPALRPVLASSLAWEARIGAMLLWATHVDRGSRAGAFWRQYSRVRQCCGHKPPPLPSPPLPSPPLPSPPLPDRPRHKQQDTTRPDDRPRHKKQDPPPWAHTPARRSCRGRQT